MKRRDSDTAAYFETRYTYDEGRRRVWRAIAGHLRRYFPPGARVCDLGSGYGDFISQIAATRRYAVDRHAAASRHTGAGVHFVCAEAARLPFSDQAMDVVFASNLLEHLAGPDLTAAVVEVARTLRPGGRFIVLQPNYYYCYRRYWDDFTHVKAWTHESLPDFLRSRHFVVERVEPRFLPFSFRGRLPKSYLLTRLYLASPWRPWAAQMLVVARRSPGA